MRKPTRRSRPAPPRARTPRRTLRAAEAELADLRARSNRLLERGRRMTMRWRRQIRAEVANSVTHGVGAGLAIAGLCVLTALAARHGDGWRTSGVIIFGAALVVLYLSSTLYHSIAHQRAKRVLRILDHSAIYLTIAGTYTPFLLTYLRGAWGWSLLATLWGLAVVGVVFKSFFVGKWDGISTALYVLMGWIAVIAWKPMLELMPGGALFWLLGGGLAYTGGVLFYAWERLPYNHAIWHGFVVTGSVCHFLAVLLYVAGPF